MFSEPILKVLTTPGGDPNTSLQIKGDSLFDPATQTEYPSLMGVPNLYSPPSERDADIDLAVHEFYEQNPFPSYEGLEDFGAIVNKGQKTAFTSQLLDAIGHNKTVLECGCGTGQLSHFLQLNNNHVLGIDASLASLKLANNHKINNRLTRSNFCRMNIFDLAIKDESFDVVISHGVLHHTHDAREAFANICRKVKPGGLVVVGLYNYYARIMTWLRARVIKLTGNNIDFVVRTKIQNAEKAHIWVADQYFNPHETWHSIDEVMTWFEENNIDYLNCSPAILDTNGEDALRLDEATDPGTAYQRVLTQLAWIFSISREGALFDVIGRKRG